MKKLQKIIFKGENEQVDFKQTISDPFKIAKTISSFANTKGGKILVGVKDDKTIIGVDPEEEKYVLETAADFYCDPPVSLEYEEVEDEEEDKTVLVVKIKESKTKPHVIRDENQQNLVYIRQRDKSLPASKNMISLMQKGKLPEEKAISSILKGIGHNEKKLLDFLGKHEKITQKQFMQIVNISKRRAQRILTDLTIKGAIRMHDHEKEAYYTL
ncbi:putative DNA binding domain-containing protein [Porifericola rhodea]|uniref:RNA-binding domain-containing protein n=1 Tax=Porifericola rhodea TaxID=930972 RepID=UPI002666E6BE|nr:RNA-binding domain-containing protein [Porifericola rhodea]WKN30533.1 putative DNA binding domain-containing protein [Porifericola rhodea]